MEREPIEIFVTLRHFLKLTASLIRGFFSPVVLDVLWLTSAVS